MAEFPRMLKLEVSTPLGRAIEIESDSVQVPGADGEFGVLPGHLPILAAMKPGVLRYRHGGHTELAAVGAGYAEADAAGVRLITEFFMPQSEVSLEAAKRDLEQAEVRMKAFKGHLGDPEHIEVQRNLDWALARIELAGGQTIARSAEAD